MRVVIRAPDAADEKPFVDAVRASRALHEPWVAPPDTPGRFATYLARSAAERYAPFLVVEASTGSLAGFINVNEIVRGAFHSAFLGYAAFTGSAGRGLMREGLGLVVDEAFGHLGLHRLEANIQPGNERSIALVRALGFRNEGFSPRYLHVAGAWRDHERWAITAEEWPR